MALFIEMREVKIRQWHARRHVTNALQIAFCVVNALNSNTRKNAALVTVRLMLSLINRTFYGESTYA